MGPPPDLDSDLEPSRRMHAHVDVNEKLLPKIEPIAPQRQRQRAGGRSPKIGGSGGSSGSARPSAPPVGCGRTSQLRLAAWLISISSFMWGFSAAVLNVCIVPDAVGSLLVDINLTTEEQERATALVVVGCVLSALTTGDCLGMSFIPESPWWLMKNRGREECRATLVFLRPINKMDAIETEVQEIARVMEHRQHEAHVTWSHLLAHKKVMATGTILVFFQAMTGINTVMLYSAKIFHFAGVTNPFFATAVVGFTNVGVLSWSLLYLNHNLEVQGIVAVSSVLVFVGGFAVGLGAVVWVMLGDITPVHIRFLGRGSNPGKNGIAKLYLILSGVAVICLASIYTFVEETSHIKTAPAKLAADEKLLLSEVDQDGLDEEFGVLRQTTDL
ncbi:hypothetical protein PF002_g6793 [Phytophthora fragariae]|uniref:Major facilitator superfamily (MFS) profile domain-containing protein n=1 Tax=Phytophthora fragariae TaxID=53985 RepID=A0A6A3ZX55_9STRA|nr:hypothetical protein PF002_g6793 [Phytophthora fragariae]